MPHDWRAFKRLSGIVPRVARALYETAISHGSHPGQWFVSFSSIRRDKWLTVETWNGEKWVPYVGTW